MSGTQNRTRKKIPALAAMALMTALTGSVLPPSLVSASPASSETSKSSREASTASNTTKPRRASTSETSTAAAAESTAAAIQTAADSAAVERAAAPLTAAVVSTPTAAAHSEQVAASVPAAKTSKVDPLTPTAAFNKLAAAGDVKGMWALIDARAASTSQSTLTLWLRRLEAAQDKRLYSLEEELSAEKVQNALMQADMYSSGDPWKSGARTGVPQADVLLDEITSQGYVLDTTEGYFFPKIDYERYLKYAKRVVPRYAEYLSLRVDDTHSEMTKDAGLIISWQEMLDRADRQSLFLQRYPNAPETQAIQAMYRQSLYVALYGTDNVPLFDYDTNVMDYYARKAYQQYLGLKRQTPFAKNLGGYMKILEKSGFKLSKAAKTYRDVRNPWLAE